MFQESTLFDKGLRQEIIGAAFDGNAVAVASACQSVDCCNLIISSGGDDFLPLHSAICGFHFHGSQRLVVQTIDALLSIGVDVNARDVTGDTALHKALQVWASVGDCSLKSVVLQGILDFIE